MIDIIFYQGAEIIFVRVDGNDVKFASGNNPNMFGPIEGLKLNYVGVVREFPDLETADDWKEQAIERFKDKIKSYDSEDEKVEYIIQDLKKHGFIPKFKQKQGFRKEVLHE